jgi:cytochrome P450
VTVTFDPYDPAVIDDPYPSYAALRAEDPVHWSESAQSWVLTRHADVAAALRDPATFSSAKGVSFNDFGGVGTLIGMDAPDHTRLRRILSARFTPRAIAELEPTVVKVTTELLDAMQRRDRVDAVAEFAAPLPTLVIADMLGIDPARWPDYKRWAEELNGLSWLDEPADAVAAKLGQAAGEPAMFFVQEVMKRKQQPTDDLIGRLVAAQAETDAATDSEIIGFCVLLMLAGNVTTTALLASGLGLLADHPDALERLTLDPTLIPGATEEMLRMESPIQGFCRTLTADVELHDRSLKAGDKAMLHFGSANRDAEVFADPDTFDVARSPNPHLGFGAGAHLCLGAALARLEGRVALEQALPRLSGLHRVPDAPGVRIQSPAFRELESLALVIDWTLD